LAIAARLGLTLQQSDVYGLAAAGRTLWWIGRIVGACREAVKSVLRRIRQRLGLTHGTGGPTLPPHEPGDKKAERQFFESEVTMTSVVECLQPPNRATWVGETLPRGRRTPVPAAPEVSARRKEVDRPTATTDLAATWT